MIPSKNKEKRAMEYPVENRTRRRMSVGVGLFLTCLVLTAVVGLFAGLMINNYTHNNYVLYAEKAEASAPVQRELKQSARRKLNLSNEEYARYFGV